MLRQLKVKQALQVRQKGRRCRAVPETEEPVVTSEAQRSEEVVMTKEDLVSKVKVLMEKGPENNVLNSLNAAERAKFLSILSETRSGNKSWPCRVTDW